VGPSSSSGHCRGTGQSECPADLKRSRSQGWHAWNINPPVEQAREGLRSRASTTTAAPLGSSGMQRTFSAYNAKYLSSCSSNSCNVMVLLGDGRPTAQRCAAAPATVCRSGPLRPLLGASKGCVPDQCRVTLAGKALAVRNLHSSPVIPATCRIGVQWSILQQQCNTCCG
jgi:hypothetical protein